MDQQAYPRTSASNSVAFKNRSPICRSESASVRLDSGSILSVTDSERTISTAESSILPEYSLYDRQMLEAISLADSVRTVPNSAHPLTSASNSAALKNKITFSLPF